MKDGEVILVPLGEADLEFLRQIRNDRRMSQYLFSRHHEISKEQQSAWFRTYLQAKDMAIFIAKACPWKSVGYAQANHIDDWNSCAEAGFHIGPEYQGNGYGTAMVRAFLDIAKKVLLLHRVELRVFADNARAIHVYQKCGFQAEGILRDAIWKDGAYRDVLMMSYLVS